MTQETEAYRSIKRRDIEGRRRESEAVRVARVLTQKVDSFVGKDSLAQVRKFWFICVDIASLESPDGTYSRNNVRLVAERLGLWPLVQETDGGVYSWSSMFNRTSMQGGIAISIGKIKSTDKEKHNGGRDTGLYYMLTADELMKGVTTVKNLKPRRIRDTSCDLRPIDLLEGVNRSMDHAEAYENQRKMDRAFHLIRNCDNSISSRKAVKAYMETHWGTHPLFPYTDFGV